MSKPPFLGNYPFISVFMNSPLTVRFFSEGPKYQSFSSLTPSYLLKVTKFLVKICQFEFLTMTEKIIFVYKLFLSLNISAFFFFLLFFCKIATPWKMLPPFSLFSATPLSKLRSCQAPPFWKFDRFNPPAERKGTNYDIMFTLI